MPGTDLITVTGQGRRGAVHPPTVSGLHASVLWTRPSAIFARWARPDTTVVDSGEDSGGEGASPAPAGPAIEAVRARPAGLDSALEELTFGLLKPLLGKGLFRSLQAPSGALLHGPPGTGKTMMAFHGLTANKIKFVYLKASDIHSKFTGVSERIIADAFDKAHLAAPAVLLIDELDCVFPARSSEAGSKHPSTLSQLLVELDNARAHRVALLATTNCIEDLDPAPLRRLPLRIHVPLPNMAARRSVLRFKHADKY
ncbi:ATPase [Tilletia horrida]|nr:ATPase [Tilletia horrida]